MMFVAISDRGVNYMCRFAAEDSHFKVKGSGPLVFEGYCGYAVEHKREPIPLEE